MKNLWKGWSVMRLIRLVVGLVLLGQGIYTGEWIWIIIGAGFSLLPILGVGCGCNSNQCATTNTSNHDTSEEISFEEIH